MKSSGRQKPGGTLASAAESKPVVDAMPHVTVDQVRPQTARGVAPVFVVVLVIFALTVGFLLGWALHTR
jgi:hypothetical protein